MPIKHADTRKGLHGRPNGHLEDPDSASVHKDFSCSKSDFVFAARYSDISRPEKNPMETVDYAHQVQIFWGWYRGCTQSTRWIWAAMDVPKTVRGLRVKQKRERENAEEVRRVVSGVVVVLFFCVDVSLEKVSACLPEMTSYSRKTQVSLLISEGRV
eukprot:scaffold6613_cov143-Amphora_coffeaeformis.AAC.1